jgi:Flp pilus assembly protein protease CpaA
MIELILVVVTFITLLVASYTDLRSREVPDWLSYGLIFSALGIRSIFSIELGWDILFSGLIGFAAFFIIGALFYYTNQWGGGDSKLLMGMGAVIGFTIPIDKTSINLVWFFTALLFVGAIYGVLFMGFAAYKKKNVFQNQFKGLLKTHKKIHVGTWIFSFAVLATSFRFHSLLALVFVIVGVFYLLIFMHSVEKSCFFTRIATHKLTEGDWLAEDIVVKGKKVLEKKTLLKSDIGTLQKHKKHLRGVLIKEGIPFVPSFLFAYTLVVFGENVWIWVIRLIIG